MESSAFYLTPHGPAVKLPATHSNNTRRFNRFADRRWEATMDTYDKKPTDKPSKLRTLDELDDLDVPLHTTSFNTCTRSGTDRRQRADRRREPRTDSRERRSGRDRRIMSCY